MIENDKIQQIPRELEDRFEQIRGMIKSDMEEYFHMPSLRDMANEFHLSIEEVAECIIYLPVDEFCDYISYLSQYEWEVVSHISEMKQSMPEVDEEDEEDFSMMESFHFMT